MEISKGHPYSTVNEKKDANDIDYINLEVAWGEQKNYEVVTKIGRGRYSLVFEGVDVRNKNRVAIKALRPVKKDKIKREYFMLTTLSHPNIVKIKDSVRDSLTKTASFVLELIPHEEFKTLYPKLTLEDIRLYTREILKTLDYMHSQGVMHRDIKPHNILIDHPHKSLKVIDFSLAELYYPEKEYSTKVASLYYKAPELLLGNVFYDYAVDIWAAGVILAGMIFRNTPFMLGNDELDQLGKIAQIVGTKEIASYCKENAHQLLERKEMRKQIMENYSLIKEAPKVTWQSLINKNNESLATEDALNLISRMLELNPRKRVTAKEALEHPFLRQ